MLRLRQKHTGIREPCSCEVTLASMVLAISGKRNSRDGSQCLKHQEFPGILLLVLRPASRRRRRVDDGFWG